MIYITNTNKGQKKMNVQKILTVNPARRDVKTATAKVKQQPETAKTKYRRILIDRWLNRVEVM